MWEATNDSSDSKSDTNSLNTFKFPMPLKFHNLHKLNVL